MKIALLGQEQGDAGSSNWTLLDGGGDRYFDVAVTFQSPLDDVPIVQVSLATVDADSAANLRVDVQAIDVTSVGFTLRMHTWADTMLYHVTANWFAVIS